MTTITIAANAGATIVFLALIYAGVCMYSDYKADKKREAKAEAKKKGNNSK